MKIKDALADFATALLADGKTQKTVKWYIWLLSESPHCVRAWLYQRDLYEFSQIRTVDLREYIVQLREVISVRTGAMMSSKTIDDYIRAMHRFFSWCSVEYDQANPMKRISFPRVTETKPKHVSIDDVIALLGTCEREQSIDRRDRAIILFLLDTGCRAAGLCGLQLHDLELSELRARLTEKRGKSRMIYFSELTRLSLESWIPARSGMSDYVFCADSGKAMTPNSLRLMLARRARRAGIASKANPHSFRHAFARGYLLNGGDLASLSKILGHAQIQTTITNYTMFTESEIQKKHGEHSPVLKLKK